jgi:predicted ATPase
VVISAATHRLVQGYFTVAALGPQTLKGVAAPVPVYRILGASVAQSRLDVAAATGLTPLVGRESEVTLLRERWAQSQAGLGQVVLLSGEAGIGKSRLVEGLHERIAGEGHLRITFRCSPYHTHSPLYPVIEYLQRRLQLHPDDPPTAKLDKLEQGLQGYHMSHGDVVPLFAGLLSVPLIDRYPPVHQTPQRQRQQTLEALVAWLLEEVERQPVLAVWEDVHWADPSTLELLDRIVEQAATARLLTLMTARPEFRPPWTPRSYLTHFTLGRLQHDQVETMVRQLTDDKPLPAEVLAQVVAKTDGVPLFVEELVKMVLESGLVREEADRYGLTEPLPPLAIPATLQDSLMARLDRLTTGRAVAQLGAVLGREFTYELIRALAPLDEPALQRGLAQLVDAELLYQRGRPPQARYLFKHALIQETAYQSLLKSTRQQSHLRSAQVLEAQFPEVVETQPELLAHHYTEAGRSAQALPYWQRAGERAIERSAYLEARAHLTKGLEVLKTVPDASERTQQELGLQTTLGWVLIATQGGASPDVERAYARAQELCRQVGDTPQLFPTLRGLHRFYLGRGQMEVARELGEQLLSLAQRVQDPVLLVPAHLELGSTLFSLGELVSARTHLEQGIALYHPQQYRSPVFLSGSPGDPGVVCRGFAAWTLWVLGYPDQAVKRSDEALILAQQLAHPVSYAAALYFAAVLRYFRREEQAARERAETVAALAREQGFAQPLSAGTILRGWALAIQGQGEEGLAQMRQGLAARQATGSERTWLFYLAMLAEAYQGLGQAEMGLNVLAEALAEAHSTVARYYEAELDRLKGELLLARSPEHYEEAEGCFRQAIATARRQQAKSLELRAAMSLSRLWQQQGKRTEARELLEEVYGWFTEGFDTADLQEAKTLLEAWS